MNAVKQCIITEITDEILVTLQGHQKNSSDRIIIPIKYLIGSFISYDEDVCTSTNRRSLQMRWMHFPYSGWLHKQQMLLLWLGGYTCTFGKLQCNGSAKIRKSQYLMMHMIWVLACDLETWSDHYFGLVTCTVVTLLAAQAAIFSVQIDALARMQFHVAVSSLAIFSCSITKWTFHR